MRQIKFRAWSGQYMIQWGFIDNIFQGPPTSSGIGVKFDNPFNMPQMQYTGLKDKNGVEIFEGDIIRWFTMGGDDRISAIEYVCDENMPNCWGFHYGDAGKNIGTLYDRPYKWEILGNIYENPELLK